MSDVYSYEKPSKLEQRAALLNLRSPDPAGSTGSRSNSPMCAGDVLAALRFGEPARLECARYFNYQTCMEMMALLVFRKYQCDMKAGDTLFYHVRILMVAQINAYEKDTKKALAEIAATRGVLSACCKVVIDDVCDPGLFTGLSARAWARKVQLNDHQAWQARWCRRYTELRRVLAELDTVAVDKIERFT